MEILHLPDILLSTLATRHQIHKILCPTVGVVYLMSCGSVFICISLFFRRPCEFCTIGERNTEVCTHCVWALDVALQINTALQIVEMYFFKFGGHIEFLDNSNSNWGRQTAVFSIYLVV